MKDKILKKKLCSVFCSYYKPSKISDTPCLGYSIISKLLETGKTITFDKSRIKSDASIETTLVQNMCPLCPFHEGDCDFILKKDNAPPCGGFIFISELVDRDVLTIDEVINIAVELQSIQSDETA